MESTSSAKRRKFSKDDFSCRTTIRKLNFSPIIQNIDENSCGSAFSDLSSSSGNNSVVQNDDQNLDQSFDSAYFLGSPISFRQEASNKQSVAQFFAHQSAAAATTAAGSIGYEFDYEAQSRPYSLPTLNSGDAKHADLASIASETLVDLLCGNKYAVSAGEYCILDARYPYEFRRRTYTRRTERLRQGEHFRQAFP